MAELVDVLDLGSSAARRGGSSPFTRTNKIALPIKRESYFFITYSLIKRFVSEHYSRNSGRFNGFS